VFITGKCPTQLTVHGSPEQRAWPEVNDKYESDPRTNFLRL